MRYPCAFLNSSSRSRARSNLTRELDEAAFRWNNRSNPYWFRDTILALVEGDTLTYESLIGK